MRILKALILLAILPASAFASGICGSGTLSTTYNPFTNKLDYVCVGGGGGGSSLPLPPGDTNYIQNSNTLQTGSTFYVSSGTVAGQLNVRSIPSTSFGHELSNLSINLSNNTFSPGHSLIFQRLGAVFPASLYFYSYGSDSSLYTYWAMGVTGASESLEVGDQGSKYILSGASGGIGESMFLSSATGITAMQHNSALGAYGATSLKKPIFGAWSADGGGGTTQRFLIDHDSTTVNGNLVVPSGVPFYSSYQFAVCQGPNTSLGFSGFAVSTPTAACVNNSSAAFAVAQFTDNGATQTVQNHFQLPPDWVGTNGVDLSIVWRSTATSGNIVWQMRTSCVGTGEVAPTSWNPTSTVTTAAQGTTLWQGKSVLTGVSVSNCSAGEEFFFEILRDPTLASDTLASAGEGISALLTTWRTLHP